MTNGITAYGMKLIPRHDKTWDCSGFLLFAALCEINGLTSFIKHVMCDENGGALFIELAKDAVDVEAVTAIAYLASQTLEQFWLDGEHGWKARSLH